MISTILSHYEITKDTMALLPARNIDYQTIVLEPHQKRTISQVTLTLIKEACLHGGSTYDGRRLAVISQTGAQNKVPIPINPNEFIYAFPTSSPSSPDCIWIFYQHVKTMKPHQKNPDYSLIVFKNYDELEVPISLSVLQRQMQRTSYCIVRFSKGWEGK